MKTEKFSISGAAENRLRTCPRTRLGVCHCTALEGFFFVGFARALAIWGDMGHNALKYVFRAEHPSLGTLQLGSEGTKKFLLGPFCLPPAS